MGANPQDLLCYKGQLYFKSGEVPAGMKGDIPMSKKIINSEQLNETFPNIDDIENCEIIAVNVTKASTSQMKALIAEHGLEIYPNHSCGHPLRPVKGNLNCYYIDCQFAVRFYANEWTLPCAIAHFLVDEGMRAFLEPQGVLCVCTLGEKTFNNKIEANFDRILESVKSQKIPNVPTGKLYY